jgi:pimeloyl-ACP methyl ester carboxylesterase
MRRNLTADELARAAADPRIREDLIRHVLSHQEAPSGVAGLRNDYAQVRRARQHADPISVACPVLVLHGDADTVVPLKQGEYWAERLSGSITVYDNAGHLFLLTRRRESSEAVRAFLS